MPRHVYPRLGTPPAATYTPAAMPRIHPSCRRAPPYRPHLCMAPPPSSPNAANAVWRGCGEEARGQGGYICINPPTQCAQCGATGASIRHSFFGGGRGSWAFPPPYPKGCPESQHYMFEYEMPRANPTNQPPCRCLRRTAHCPRMAAGGGGSGADTIIDMSGAGGGDSVQ